MKYNKILIIVILFLLSSCKNENIELSPNERGALSINDYFEVLTMKPSGGRIKLENNTSVDFQNIFRYNNIEATIKHKIINDFELKNQRGDLLTHKKSNELNKLFGEKINFSIDGFSNQKSGNDPNNEVYIPELLNVSIDTDKLQAGTTVSWNVDELNINGLIIWYEYTPSIQDKMSVLNETGIRHIRGGITIPDAIGTYTITSEDLANIPNDARVTLHVTRAGFNVSQNNNGEQTALIGATTVSKELRIEK